MRGTVLKNPLLGLGIRFIPAHAGNRTLNENDIPRTSVHPRACGEQLPWGNAQLLPDGSSPRMRGTENPRVLRAQCARFIPAHAGNSVCLVIRHLPQPVHPRACGEQMTHLKLIEVAHGSSPRMRGTDCLRVIAVVNIRFIPAHAGNRPGSCHSKLGRTVHPRACGEQLSTLVMASIDSGSSPRMRGTASPPEVLMSKHRFIPAHAGNRWPSQSAPSPAAVHPRACGEQVQDSDTTDVADGSSPRMRGTESVELPALDCDRFIPAHAGNRFITLTIRRTSTVHPRACGEQTQRAASRSFSTGSSPRMRGTAGRKLPPGY